MTVYVDDGKYPLKVHGIGKMTMSHMIANTHEELIDMAEKIGVSTKWIQNAGTRYEHFDIAQSKKKEAIAAGASPIRTRELAKMLASRDLDAYLKPKARWPSYEDRLNSMFSGVEDITEQDEIDEFDFIDGRYVPKRGV